MSSLLMLKSDLQKLANPEKAEILARFFKTGKGQYDEGDIFLGVMVPGQRRIAKKYSGLSLRDVRELLSSGTHEHRLVALFILVQKYKKADSLNKKVIADFYLKHTRQINNWDLVDLSQEISLEIIFSIKTGLYFTGLRGHGTSGKGGSLSCRHMHL